ncbi:dynein assembly factor with WDR repeat domains 1-like [Hydractinia symbiolongicarpus]|uniref:dynein assembly factor with WDR repeat domains 1-like n=1 Tax=Hydractinia symbiolongicarpus TaxID=13093 RepID=UPI00254F93AE|nr:dynein assembly factor with WDR repeat domains 1-like [Hydractinia symbiolongicarpus]XP_057295534.1 dynein assembly factor with WDR repeat domains 1-like [Hydractinia symbiolongicarpus]XP_057295535.1 dynein assembly factor with WDR repeat domains 1-like [Hydractinia symbiolongicarpus]
MGKEHEIFHGKVHRTLNLGQAGAILACGLSNDDKLAASCSTNKKVLLWDVESGRCTGSLDGHKADVSACSFSANLLATGSLDGMIFLWKFKEGKRTSRINVHAGAIHACVISPDGRFLASASEDKTARVYTIRGGDGEFIQGPQCKELLGHTDGINDISFSYDSCAIVTASTDGSIKIWDTETGECLVMLSEEGQKVIDARFSSDGRYIVTMTNNFISVWNISKKKKIWSIEEDKGLQSLSCHPSENIFIVVSMDGTIAGYDITNKTGIFKKGSDHTGPVLACEFSQSGNMAVTGGVDGKVLVWQ